MEQPVGTVDGSLTMFRPDRFGGGEWWQVSRHSSGNRTSFWERVFRGPTDKPVLVAEFQTDALWGREAAEEWFVTHVQNHLRSGFKLSHYDGNPGPREVAEPTIKPLGHQQNTNPGKDTQR